MAQQRQLFRVGIDRTGQVRRGAETFPCKVVDVTEKGVRLEMDHAIGVGEELYLEFTLTEQDQLGCAIQVTHSRPPHLGAVIVDIAADHRARLADFIQQLNALNMIGF